jgi:hypothetical protein
MSEEIEKHDYITIDGIEPEKPKLFMETKKFKVVGVAFAFLAGLICYFFIFAK